MNDSNPSRREFITGRRKSDGDDAEELEDSTRPESVAEMQQKRRESAYVEHLSKKAMACQFEFVFNMGQYADAADAAMLAFDELERLETQMTIYREWSELIHINQSAAEDWVPVEPKLFELLLLARDIWKQTAGAFDITTTPLTQLWGFAKRQGRVPSQEELETTLPQVGMQHVEFDETQHAVRFARSGTSLNLGGIGKGYALDRIVELVEGHGMNHMLVHGGQSSLIGRGQRTGIEQSGRVGWTVGLSHPIWPEKRIAEFQLVDRALGTSGTGRQSFYYQGKKYGHILDPRSGHPAEGVLSATVLAPTAAEADALATAFYVAGVDFAMSFCQSREDLSLCMATSGDRRGEVRLHTYGLSESDWRQYETVEDVGSSTPDQ